MEFRELRPDDVDGVYDLAYRAFMEGYYTDVSEKSMRTGTYNYVIDEIRDSTFAEVYVEQGKVMGFIMGYVNGMEKRYPISDYRHLNGESKEFKRIGRLIDECNSRMKSSCGYDTDCEALLFATDDGCRGKGVGTRLMDDLIAHFRDNGCKSMFLFTGDNCTMEYYDRKGYILAGKEMLDIGTRVRDCRMYLKMIG